MPLIRRTDTTRGPHAEVFNFEDISRRADDYLEQVRGEAKKILDAATAEADEIRRRAEAEGLARANDTLDARVREQLQPALPALLAAIDEIQHAKAGCLEQWERKIVQLATAIAARVIRRELTHAPEIPVELVREALELAAGSEEIRVLMNPDDYRALHSTVHSLVAELARSTPTTIVADPSITRGGCRVETKHGAIDQEFDVQLARIESELT